MTAPTVPERKRAGALVAGEWIATSSLDVDVDGDSVVRYVETYPEPGYSDRALVIVRSPGDDRPFEFRVPADLSVRLLSAEEVERAKDEERRERLAMQFEQLADMARRTDVPFPRSEMLLFNLPTRAEVRAVGEALGLEPGNEYGSGLQVSWPRGHETYDPGLHVLWSTHEKEPEPTPEPIGEHYFVSGAIGGPGEFSAECACGTSFSGFDSLDDVMAELNRHIAGPATQADIDAAKFSTNPLVAAAAQAYEDADDDPTGLTYSREDDDPQVVRPHSPRVPMQTGAVVDGGELVDETPAEPVTVYFSFGHGQTDPDTGKDLIDHYVTVIGPSHQACRKAMFASRYSPGFRLPCREFVA